MCGFLSYFQLRKNTNLPTRKKFKNSLLYQESRGPDYSEIVIDKNFMVGHNRLSIRDLKKTSNQPFRKYDNFILLYNGEIYNTKTLLNKLEELDITFNKNSDTEILYELIINFGLEKTLNLIKGMFSFVFIDITNQKIYTARDHFGQKPLFYYLDKDQYVVSTNINSITEIVDHPFEISRETSLEYLSSRGQITPGYTFFKNIYNLEAGNYTVFNLNDPILKKKRYFFVENLIQENIIFKEDAQLTNKLDFIFHNVIDDHMISDAKVGVLLSGGIDSSLIYYYAQQNNPKIKSFTKECEDIEKIPNTYINKIIKDKDQNYWINESKKSYLKKLIKYIKFGNRPSPWGGGPHMMNICKEARKNDFKVLLGGDCADEYTAGYKQTIDLIASYKGDLSVLDHLSNSVDNIIENRFNIYQRNLRKRLIEKIPKSEDTLLNFARITFSHNLEFFLQSCNLPHSDTFSMIESIELRNPYLDFRLITTLLNCSSNLIIGDHFKKLTGKLPLKKLARKTYAKDFPDNYFVEKEGTRNYSKFISNNTFWNWNLFMTFEIFKNQLSLLNSDWKLRFALINLEIFYQINHGKNKNAFLTDILSNQGIHNLI